MSKISDKEAEQILNTLDAMHQKIRDIERKTNAMREIHRLLYPEEYEKAVEELPPEQREAIRERESELST